ncbi:MAG: hypothetical protein RSE91_03215, partial [Bacilli bacterium]
MRKVITFVGSIAILFLLYQFGITFFLKDHSLVYKIMKDNNTFEIKEDYHRFSKTEIYELAVKKDNITVYFTIKEKLHNQKQIVKTINFYEKDGMLCVKPTIIGNNQPEIMCSKGNETLSSSYLLSINNPIIISFIEELKSKEILHSSYSYTEKAETFFKDTVYQSNIMKDYTIGVWNYRGVNVYTKKDKKNLTPLTSDRYENTHSIMSNSYWIFPNYDLKYDFNSLYLINMEDLAKKTINLGDIMISFNSYFNGESS